MNILALYFLTVILGSIFGFINSASDDDKRELFWIILHAVVGIAIVACTIIAYVSIKGIA